MKRGIKLSLKIIGGVVATLLVLTVAAVFTLNTSWCQQKVLNYAVSLLEERLQTKVEIDSVSVSLWTQDIHLLGLRIEDQQERKMLEADHLAVSLDLTDLLDHKVDVSEAEITGLRMRLYQPKDSAANFQFVVDAFKSNKTDSTEQRQKEGGQSLAFDISQLTVKDVDIERHWVTKKGFQQTDNYALARLKMAGRSGRQTVTIDSLRWKTDNHQPRKNEGRPHRGAFDAGHLDITADMELRVNHIGKDTFNISLTRFVATDTLTGINVRDLHFDAGINKTTALLTNIVIQQESTTLSMDSATIDLPNKKEGRTLAWHTSEITGNVILRDIAKPFAPALRHFAMPLELKVTVDGADSTLLFNNIVVNTPDQSLKIEAEGDAAHVGNKEGMKMQFHVHRMTTSARTAKRVIDQFVVKKFMMRQLNNLGTITYVGDFDILYKKEKFRGVLKTSAGMLRFDFTIDGKTKYLQGQASTRAINLSKVLEMRDLGDVAFTANFQYDISKQRTARVRRLRGGKLPIGRLNAREIDASYKKIRMKHLILTLESDGTIAKGQILQEHSFADLLCNFSFTHTDAIHKMKIMPGIRLHKKDKKDKKDKKKDKKKK